MNYTDGKTIHEQLSSYGAVTPVRQHNLWANDDDQTIIGMVLNADHHDSVPLLFQRHVLIAMAREILRALNPTTEDEILAALHRIEDEMKKS